MFPLWIEGIGKRTYIADILGEKNGKMYIFEVDGTKGHSTKRDKYKMVIRDEALESKGYKTIRIRLNDLTSRHRKPDYETVIAEIEYQLDCQKKECVSVNLACVKGNTTANTIN